MKENQYGYSDLEWGAMTLDEKIATERFFEIQELKAEVERLKEENFQTLVALSNVKIDAHNAALSEAIEKIKVFYHSHYMGPEKDILEILEGLKIKP